MNFGWITSAIDALTTQNSGLYLAEGQSWLKWLGIILLTMYALKWVYAAVTSYHGHLDLTGFVQFVFMFMIASALLIYYDKPLPGTSDSVATILPTTAQQLADIINQTAQQKCLQEFKTMIDNIQEPQSILADATSWIVWTYSTILMYVAEALMFAVQIIGFIAIGVGVLWGPVAIPFFIVPRLSWIFWNWLQFMIEFSFWRFVSAAVVFVWATAWSSFIEQAVNGDYTIPHFAELAPYMLAMCIGMMWSIFQVAAFTRDLFKGTATAGANFVGGMAVAIRALAA